MRVAGETEEQCGHPILWEFGEYLAFIRDSPQLATAYTDTLGDLLLGLSGATIAAAITGFVLQGRSRRL